MTMRLISMSRFVSSTMSTRRGRIQSHPSRWVFPRAGPGKRDIVFELQGRMRQFQRALAASLHGHPQTIDAAERREGAGRGVENGRAGNGRGGPGAAPAAPGRGAGRAEAPFTIAI